MNNLTKFLVSSILNEDKNTIALFGGGFKPPTRGHLEVILQGLRDNPEVNEVYVFVGKGIRNNISQDEALKIWEMYLPLIPVKTTILKSGAPLKDMKNFIGDREGINPYIFIGARANNEEDDKDVAERSKFFEKYGGIPKRVETSDSNVSGTKARNAALNNNKKELFSYFPNALSDSQKEKIYDMLRSVVKENVPDAEDDGKAAPFGSGYGKVNENASYSKDIDVKGKIDQLTQHMIDKGYNIEPLPSLEFVDGDNENARDFFGKTAYYDPNTQTLVLYTEGRHPKDIVRSYAHEMIHHIQNLEGRLDNINTTNTQEDDYLNDIEAEANLKGTMTFRNWTDSLNEVGDATQKPYNWNRTVSKDPDDGLIEGVDYRFTTDLDTNYVAFFQMVGPMEYEFGFNIPGGNQAQTSNKGELFRVMATMVAIMKDFMDLMGNDWSEILFSGSKDPSRSEDNRRDKLYMAYIKKNLPSNITIATDGDDMTVLMNDLAESLNEAIVDDKIECDNCGWSWKIVDGGDDLFICHKCDHDNTPVNEVKSYKHKHGFDKKLGKDPFGLNQFARELMAEGAYDSLTTKLTKATINKWVEDSKKKPMPKKSFVDIDVDEVDGKGREIEFNYVGLVEFTNKVDGYEVDGTSNSGEDKGKISFIATMFKVNPEILPQAWSKISSDISDVIRHEIEHLTQAGDNTRTGKYKDDDIQIRDMINKLKILPKKNYYLLDKEVDAMLQGLYLKAKKTRKPFANVINNYLDIAPGIETKEDKEMILNLWKKRRKALSLPVFENEEKNQYKVYVDMDGVIADFDKRFKDLSGMSPTEYKDKYGTSGFWDFIDEENKIKFWVGIPVMDGAKKLIDFVKPYNYELLTAPSAKQQSRLGKSLWIRNHTPDLFGEKPKFTFKKASEKHQVKSSLTKFDILIDDRASTISQWNAAGGTGILFTSSSQAINDLKKLGL
jgi:hypothetical protein